MQPDPSASFVLPLTVITRRDALGLQLVLEKYAEDLVRQSVTNDNTASTVPADIVQLCDANGIHSLDVHVVEQLRQSLRVAIEHSPLIRLALSTEPDDNSLTRFIDWFRREIHPSCLLQINVQPSIAGGCIVRTGSRIYDFSFRHMLLVNQPKLEEVLKS